MFRTNVYLTKEQREEINRRAAIAKRPKAAVLRDVIEEGLKAMPSQTSNSAEVLLKMAEEAKKFRGSGPKDLSINHDYYIWGGQKRDPKAQA
jgi:predicted DNA-binding protein